MKNDEKATISKSEYISMKEQIVELSQKVEWFMEPVRLAKLHQFGASSEKSQYDQFNLFNEAEATAEVKAEPELVEIERHYRKKAKENADRLPLDLPVKVVKHTLPRINKYVMNVARSYIIMKTGNSINRDW